MKKRIPPSVVTVVILAAIGICGFVYQLLPTTPVVNNINGPRPEKERREKKVIDTAKTPATTDKKAADKKTESTPTSTAN